MSNYLFALINDDAVVFDEIVTKEGALRLFEHVIDSDTRVKETIPTVIRITLSEHDAVTADELERVIDANL